jgi:hypothetical protein
MSMTSLFAADVIAERRLPVPESLQLLTASVLAVTSNGATFKAEINAAARGRRTERITNPQVRMSLWTRNAASSGFATFAVAIKKILATRQLSFSTIDRPATRVYFRRNRFGGGSP